MKAKKVETRRMSAKFGIFAFQFNDNYDRISF